MLDIPGLAALHHRNFRLLWVGQIASGLGTNMQAIAIGWHIYQMTDSALALGFAAFFRAVPFMTLSLLGGAFADSMDRRRLLMVTQGIQMAVSVALAAATVAGIESPWIIYAVALAGGVLQAFDGPARQALVPSLVPREMLANALTLNTLARQAATIVGPGLGGVAIAVLGVGPTYLVNALGAVVVVLALVQIHGVAVKPAPSTGSNLQRIGDGLTFAWSEPLVLLPLAIDFLTRALGSPRGLLPVYARDIFGVGPEGLGWLAAAAAVGAVAGGFWLGSLRRTRWPIVLMLSAYMFEGITNAGFGVSPNIVIGWVMLCLGGICNVGGEVLFATIVQLRTPDHLRGRTTALTGMFASGGPQLGQFQIGVLAEAVGPTTAVVFNGLVAAGVVLAIALLPGLRERLFTRELTDLSVDRETAPTGR
ncbi:MAG: MFS transporter [Dehalococcoidia bacterium]|nr:MFS transporter [Dehalococcoidia bacterium]